MQHFLLSARRPHSEPQAGFPDGRRSGLSDFLPPALGGDGRQAESYFSRLRRAEIGTHHHIAAPYLNAYAAEMSFREDNRRVSNGAQATMVTEVALGRAGVAPVPGYWQR